MIGPQILVIVPVSILGALVLAVRRSPWALVLFGFPLLFGLWSSWIGIRETPGYEWTGPFLVSMGVGLLGYGLVVSGLWKAIGGMAKGS